MAFFEKVSHLATAVSKSGKTRFPGPCWRGPMGQIRRPVEPELRVTQTKQRLCPWGSAAANGDMVGRSGGVKAPTRRFLNVRLTPLL